jgi:RNA polymerase sigma-70 factor, ECF subfamily
MPLPDPTPTGPRGASALEGMDDAQLVAALRAGDEKSFLALVEQHHASLVRVAMGYVSSHAVAEEVAQDAWVGLLEGLDRFEGRSSLKTWLFRILTNLAKTRGERERRNVAFSDLVTVAVAHDEAAVPPGRFQPTGGRNPGHWKAPPRAWDVPEERLLSKEILAVVDAAVAELPVAQGQVITLRDIEGWSAAEVCNALQISDANQRVLLHRARSRVRGALEAYLDPDAVAGAERGFIARLLRRRR